MVTHPTTNQPACSLSMTEQTGSPVFYTLWPYVERLIVEKDLLGTKFFRELSTLHRSRVPSVDGRTFPLTGHMIRHKNLAAHFKVYHLKTTCVHAG